MAGTVAPVRITVFILDDHEIVRLGLRVALEHEGDIAVVGQSGLAAGSVDQILRLRPDVAILDPRLPDGSGIDVCRELQARAPEIACLVLTAYDDDDALFAAIMAGARGFLLKQAGGLDLANAVRLLADGRSLLDPEVTCRVLDHLRDGTDEALALARLSPSEHRVLELIGSGMTNREIACEMSVAEKTVKNQVSSMFAKLGLRRRTQAAVYAARHVTQPD